jgi:2-dehydro-3-deoxyphosphogluconate aldolase/(4S)-4-hydroxy-2-oxoglutarate aldolase
MTLREQLARVGIVPVITIHDAALAVPLAEALCAGGLTVLEVTLRSPAALPAIEAMRRAVPQALVGAGTVVNREQLAAAVASGSQFLVAPGFSAALADEARRGAVPLLPGVATPTELLAALDAGIDTVKFFPAEQAGGVPMLKALFAPFPTVAFCPTGGIGSHNALAYLAQPNVVAVGMSSVAPAELIAAGDFAAITALARSAAALRAVPR